MPEHAEKEKGGLISHLHFQFGRKKEQIVKSNGKLRKPHWYATMCDADATTLQRCNIVRALHKLPMWKELPEIWEIPVTSGGQQRYIRNNRKNGITKSPEYSRHVEYSGDFCKQDTGVEPAYSAWEADALPIDESCMNFLYYSTNLVDGKRFLKNLEIFYREKKVQFDRSAEKRHPGKQLTKQQKLTSHKSVFHDTIIITL